MKHNYSNQRGISILKSFRPGRSYKKNILPKKPPKQYIKKLNRHDIEYIDSINEYEKIQNITSLSEYMNDEDINRAIRYENILNKCIHMIMFGNELINIFNI
jgi:hypothetical protein